MEREVQRSNEVTQVYLETESVWDYYPIDCFFLKHTVLIYG